MGNARQVGRIRALVAALGTGNVRRAAARVTVSVGAAAVVVAGTVVPASASSSEEPPPDRTALIMCGTTCPTPDEFWIESVKNQFIAPTHPGQDIDYVGVTAPMEFWPITGLFRLLGLALGPPEIWGPGGPGWPDQPWWKLSGLFDLTANQSLRAGVADLEAAMAANGNDHLVVYGNSQGAGVANVAKRKLAEQYPSGSTAPDIDFVLGGDPNLPNGGLMSRFPGLYIPILNMTFNGPAATNTQFKTVEINRRYDGFSDFPLYPLNLIADLNAVLGVLYVHTYPFDISLPADPTTSPAYQGTHGDTEYYLFETENLPLFAPLRMLGVPESVIDVFEPFFRVIVELGYDRTIPAWQPTPARLIPKLNPWTVATDLVNAIGEGINNAVALFDPPAKPGTETAATDISPRMRSIETSAPTDQVTPAANSTTEPSATEPSTTEVAEIAEVTETVDVAETADADASRQVTPVETVPETGQVMSEKDAIETAEADEVSAGPTAASAPEAAADAATAGPSSNGDSDDGDAGDC